MNRIILWIMFFCLLTFEENSAQKSLDVNKMETKKSNIKSSKQVTDSLKKVLSTTTHDKVKVELLNSIATRYITVLPDSSITYANSSLLISKSKGFISQEANSYLILGQVYEEKNSFEISISYLNKALEIYKTTNDEYGRNQCNFYIGKNYHNKNEFEKARKYFDSSLDYFRKVKNKNFEILVLRNIAEIFRRVNNFDSAFTILNYSLTLAINIGNKVEQCKIYTQYGLYYSYINDYHTSNNFYFKGLEIAELLNDLELQAKILNNLGVNFTSLSDFTSALDHYQRSMEISKIDNNKRSVALRLANIGGIYLKISDFDSALEHFNSSMSIVEDLNDKGLIKNNCSNLGMLYEKLEKFELSLEYYKRYTELAKELGDKISQALGYGHIGDLLFRLNDFNGAIENLTKAIEIGININHHLSVSSNYLILGNIYQKIDKPKASLDYYKNGLEIAKNYDLKGIVSQIYKALGTQYYLLATDSSSFDLNLKEEYFNKAIFYLEKASDEFKSRNELLEWSLTLITLSDTYNRMGDYKNSLECFKKSTTIKDSIYSSETKKKIAQLEAVKNLQLKEKENELLKNDAIIKESELNLRNRELINLANIRKIQQLEIEKQSFDITKKNNELNLLKQDKDIRDLKLKQNEIENQKKEKDIQILNNKIEYQSLVRNFMIVSLMLLGILAVVLLVFFKRKNRDNKLLENKNHQIENANIELERLNEDLVQHQNELTLANTTLENQRIELKKYSEGLESIVSERTQELIEAMKEIEKSSKLKTEIIANMNHEIRTPLSFIKSASAYIKMLIPSDNSDDELIDTIDSLNQGVNRLNKTMELFADLSSLKSGNFIPRIEPINLKSILDHHYMVYKKEIANQGKAIALNFNSSIDDVYIQGDESCVHSSIGFIIDNAVKFTNSGFVNIDLSYDNKCSYIVSIQDSGIGISEEYKSKIFEPFSQEDMSATRKYEGIGLSLALAHEYSLINNFKINFESEQGKGTKFILNFKKCDIDF